jgi:hypothetical protein
VSAFGHPAALAATALLLAAVVHPATHAAAWLPGAPIAIAALALLVVLCLLVRARGRADLLLAAGAVLLLAALAWDGARGRQGVIRLAPGQGTANFTEQGPTGRWLGLRPLGFTLGLERILPNGGVRLSLPQGTHDLTDERAIAVGGFRLASPRLRPTGEADRLVVVVSGDGTSVEAEVRPDVPGRAGELVIALDHYFPDFALDERQQPYTRSADPRNPAALLNVEGGGKSYRVFVLQAMPGLHRVQELGRSFALRAVDPEIEVEVAVHNEPAARLLLLGAFAMAAGAALAARESS